MHVSMSSNSIFLSGPCPSGLLVSGLYDTYNEGPGEVHVQIHQRYTSILNMLQCKSRAVPVEDQCELVFDTCPTSLFVPYVLCSSLIALPLFGRLYQGLYFFVSCHSLLG
jgi:hypothetical protein